MTRSYLKSYTENGVHYKTREYILWRGVVSRCTDGNKPGTRLRSYSGCGMSDEFKNFDYFAEWCNAQQGFKEQTKGRMWQLDKDIVGGGKLYSQDVCVFVPACINTFMNEKSLPMEDALVGVCFRDGKYTARCMIEGRRKWLGSFDSVEDAFVAYKKAKLGEAMRLIREFSDRLDSRVVDKLRSKEIAGGRMGIAT